MASFNGKAFEKKLKEMDASQTSIQTVSLWIIHHRQVGKQVVNAWANFMKKSKPDRRLLLLYLANDVVQNGRKKAKELIQLFGKSVKDCMQLLSDPKIKQSVGRVLNIWEERKIYEKDFVAKLKTTLEGNKKPKVVKTIPPDYKLSKVINGIRHMKELESSISKKNSHLSLLKVDASDLEAVKQVKDRFGVDKFCREFEESKAKLEDYCNTLSRCLNDKRSLVSTLQGCDAFYEAATEEAKIIVTAYKTFGNRLVSMKKKLGSKIRKLEEKKKKEQQENDANDSDKVGASPKEDKEAEKKDEEEPDSDKGDKDKADTADSNTPVNTETPDEQSTTPVMEEEAGTKKKEAVVDNTKVEDMELDSESDGEVSSGDGPLYDPHSAGHGFEDHGREKVDYDALHQTFEESDPGIPEATEELDTPPMASKGFPNFDNLPGISALQTGMVSAVHISKVMDSPSSSHSTDFAPSPEGTPEDLFLEEDKRPARLPPPNSSQFHQPLPPPAGFDSLFEDDIPYQSVAQQQQQIQPTKSVSPSRRRSLSTEGISTDNRMRRTSLNIPNELQSTMDPTAVHMPTPFPSLSQSSSGVDPSRLELPNFPQTQIPTTANMIPSKPPNFGENILSFPSPRSWVQKVANLQETNKTQYADPSLPTLNSPLLQYRAPDYQSNALPGHAERLPTEQSLKVLKSEAILAEAENAPSPSPSGGSTPTQDERIELPVVRPMDVLTQLINRARGIPGEDKGQEPLSFSGVDIQTGNSGAHLPSLLMGLGNISAMQQPPSLRTPLSAISPATPAPLSSVSIPPAYTGDSEAGYLKGYDNPLVPNESFNDFSSSLGGLGGQQPFRDNLDSSKLNLLPEDRSLTFPKFPIFEQIEIIKGQGPNGVFLDDKNPLSHQLPLLDGNEVRNLNDAPTLSPRTQFLQGAAGKEFEGSTSSEESQIKHHRSRKRSSRSRDRSPKYRDRPSKHRESLTKQKETSSKSKDRSPKHRSPKRRDRHHSPRQRERSPKHSSKRRKHSSSKGRDSYSPEREKHSSSRRRDRSPSVDQSRSSTEDVFYNDRRSPTPEMDSLPLGTPLSPRNVRSFELLAEAQNRELPLATSHIPLFSPAADLLLASPSIPPSFTQPFQNLNPTLPITTPPRPFLAGPVHTQSSGVLDPIMQVNAPPNPNSMLLPQVASSLDPPLAPSVPFLCPPQDVGFSLPEQTRPESLEAHFPVTSETFAVPVSHMVEDQVSIPGTTMDYHPDSHNQLVDSRENNPDSFVPPYFHNVQEPVGHVQASYEPDQAVEEEATEPDPPYDDASQLDSQLTPSNDENEQHNVSRDSQDGFSQQAYHMEEPSGQSFPEELSEEHPMQQKEEPQERKMHFPLKSAGDHRPHFEERTHTPYHQRRDHGRFGEPRFQRRAQPTEPRYQHPNERLEPRFRQRNELVEPRFHHRNDQGEPRFQHRNEQWKYRFPLRTEQMEPRFGPREDFHRLRGPGVRKVAPHFQGRYPPRGPRFPPHRFQRPPFPQGPPRTFAPRGPVF